jgi:hypothetical protein
MTSGIVEILKDDSGVQALAGLNTAGSKYKVYPVIAPQDEKPPYITVFKSQNDPITSLTKQVVSELDYPTVTVNCWAKNFRTADLMFEAVRNALDNKSASTDAGYDFERIWLVDDRDGHESERGMYVKVGTFRVEQRRVAGAIYQLLALSNFVKWGGLWNWSDESNALPTGTNGTIWITEGDVDLSGKLIPDGTLMTSKIDNPTLITHFSFNV